jgi:hypothetical protein
MRGWNGRESRVRTLGVKDRLCDIGLYTRRYMFSGDIFSTEFKSQRKDNTRKIISCRS